MLKKKAYLDPSRRLHDKNGRFIKKPKSVTGKTKSFVDLETPYFTQDDEKENTYNRTGVMIEIERDNLADDFFTYGMLAATIINGIYVFFKFCI